MTYRNELGIMGNIQMLMQRETNDNNRIIENKSAYDQDHIAMEQALTDAYLDGVETQQDLTDLMLTMAEGE